MNYSLLKYAEKISANTKTPLKDTEWSLVERLYADGVTLEKAIEKVEWERSGEVIKQQNKFVWDN